MIQIDFNKNNVPSFLDSGVTKYTVRKERKKGKTNSFDSMII